MVAGVGTGRRFSGKSAAFPHSISLPRLTKPQI
jgi:hypothetical protein